MIIGKLKFSDTVLALSAAEDMLRREVNPHVYSPREFKSKVAGREPSRPGDGRSQNLPDGNRR